MKKLNREVVAKNASRFFLVIMSFVLILSLCSMASSTGEFELIIQNPDNIHHDYTIQYTTLEGDNEEEGLSLDFGINIAYGVLSNGTVDGIQLVPQGHYSMIYVVGVNPNGGTTLTCNGTSYYYSELGISCYVTDNPVINVSDDFSEDVSGLIIFVPIETQTSSITSVWTSITNWVISSLNTVQGLFYGAGEEVITPDTSSFDTVVYNGVTYYPFAFASAEEAGGGRVYLNGVEIFEDGFGQTVTTINGQQFVVVSNGGVDILLLNSTNEFTYAPVGLEIVITSDGSLTLLGTLAVIGLSISLVFLVIGVIQRFLKLRG